MNYQGKLTDTEGNPLTGPYNMTFYLFTAASGGSAIWSENHTSVAVTDGIYNVILGSINPLATGLFNDNDLVYLEVEIEGESLAPRQQLTSAPYALKARVSDAVVSGAITTVMIKDGAVDSQKLDDDAVTGTKIADGTVTAVDIAGGSGSGLDADRLDGLEASDFMSSSADNWVNETGDTMTGPLSVPSLQIDGTRAFIVKVRIFSSGMVLESLTPQGAATTSWGHLPEPLTPQETTTSSSEMKPDTLTPKGGTTPSSGMVPDSGAPQETATPLSEMVRVITI